MVSVCPVIFRNCMAADLVSLNECVTVAGYGSHCCVSLQGAHINVPLLVVILMRDSILPHMSSADPI